MNRHVQYNESLLGLRTEKLLQQKFINKRLCFWFTALIGSINLGSPRRFSHRIRITIIEGRIRAGAVLAIIFPDCWGQPLRSCPTEMLPGDMDIRQS